MKKRVIVLGSSGMLSTALIPLLSTLFEVEGYSHEQVDITQQQQIEKVIEDQQPDYVINCAAYTKVDDCEKNADLAFAVNRDGAKNVAQAVARVKGARMVQISTDFVFDGTQKQPYVEFDEVHPQSVYGKSKAEGEMEVWDQLPQRSLIIRTSWLFGEGGGNFVDTILRLSSKQNEISVVTDQVGRPTYTKDLAQAILNCLNVNAMGWVHFANAGARSWNEFARAILKMAGLQTKVIDVSSKEFVRLAKRPAYSVLSTERYEKLTGAPIRPWTEALQEYLANRTDSIQS